MEETLTEDQEAFVALWFFASPLMVLGLLVLVALVLRERADRRWPALTLATLAGGGLPLLLTLAVRTGLSAEVARWNPSVLEHLQVAAEEEVAKFGLALAILLLRGRPGAIAAGLVGAAVATGFTIVENAQFFLTAPSFRVFEQIVVSRTFVPVHAVLTSGVCAVTGAALATPGRAGWRWSAVALAVAITLHALSNLRLQAPAGWLDEATYAAFVLAAVGLVAWARRHRASAAQVAPAAPPR